MKKIIVILLLAILLQACEKFLEEVDYSNVTGDNFYTTSEGIECLVNACYTPLRFYYGKEFSLAYTELGTDLFTAGNGWIDNPYAYYRKDMVRMVDKGRDKNSDYWRYFYLGLNNTNAAIARIPASELSKDLKNIRLGEALFLRAFYLWHIVNIWGGVHFTTEETKKSLNVLNRTPENVFYEQIIKDLTQAISLLPTKSKDYGRVTKPAAQALLARVYLYVKNYEKAYAYADTVITNYNFKLLNNFSKLWDVNNEQNEEIIWSVIWSDNDLLSATILQGQQDNPGEWFERAPGNQLHLFFVMVYQEVTINGKTPVQRDLVNGRSFNRLIPTKYLLNLYNENIDSRYYATFQNVWYCNNPIKLANGDTMKVGDTAIFVTKYPVSDSIKLKKPYKIFDINTLYDSIGTPLGTRKQNFTMKKFLDPTRDPANVNDQSSKFDVYIFRLAEMYFIAAESQYFLGNKDLASYYINAIRKRAAYPGKENEMEISSDQISLDFILEEKAREFAGEYIRWFDLKRTDKLVERVRLYNPDAAPNIQPYHRVRPIPENELNSVVNKSEFYQNEGYY